MVQHPCSPRNWRKDIRMPILTPVSYQAPYFVQLVQNLNMFIGPIWPSTPYMPLLAAKHTCLSRPHGLSLDKPPPPYDIYRLPWRKHPPLMAIIFTFHGTHSPSTAHVRLHGTSSPLKAYNTFHGKHICLSRQPYPSLAANRLPWHKLSFHGKQVRLHS